MRRASARSPAAPSARIGGSFGNGERQARDAASLLIDADERRQLGPGGVADGAAERVRRAEIRQVAPKQDRPAATALPQRFGEARGQLAPPKPPTRS